MENLNDTHKQVCKDYLAFMRYKRTQHVRDIHATFTDLKESRLQESTFTREEVEDMIDGLSDVVKGDVETELINSSHTNVLVLRKMMEQGEKWKLTFKLETGALEDRHALDDIARFERQESASSSIGVTKLQPLKETASPALIKHEMDSLKGEADAARKAQQQADEHSVTMARENEQLKQQVAELEAKLKAAASTGESSDTSSSRADADATTPKATGDEAEKQLQQKQAEFEQAKQNFEKELKESKAEVLSVTSRLEEVEAALEGRVNAVPQFVNMRKMLATKNQQIKELREQMKK